MVERRYNKGESNANNYKAMNMTLYAENRVPTAHLRYLVLGTSVPNCSFQRHPPAGPD